LNTPTLSIVLPVHNERDNLAPLLDELETALAGKTHEIVAVDDGSTDDSLTVLMKLRERHPELIVLALEAHAGQSAATMAGCDAARGEIVVTMDADGQNDPHDIPALLERLSATSGCVAVVGYRAARRDSAWKRFQSWIANAARNRLTGDAVRDTGCALKAVRRDVFRTLPRFDGMHRFLPTLIRLHGGLVIEAPVAHRPRRFGHSKYGMWNRAQRGLWDAMGVRWLRRTALRYRLRT
jgi:glycosyltransferase involved in cell wall biosynthesis